MSAKTIVASIVILEAYIWIGAAIFYAVEFRDLKKPGVPNHELNITQLLEGLRTLTDLENGSYSEMIEHIELALKNTSTDKEVPTMTTEEAIIASHSFAVSVVSTIGYGNITPTTPLGKILVFVYALLGIPVCITGLAEVGSRLAKNGSVICSKVFKSLNKKPSFLMRKIIALSIGLCIGFFVRIVVPSILYSYLENWTFLDSFYHTFVTVTTIGFGDFVTKLDNGNLDYSTAVLMLYVPLRNLLIIGGLSWLATVTTITKEILEHVFNIKEEPPSSEFSV